MKNKIAIISILFVTISCSTVIERKNNQEDVKKAEQELKNFYQLISEGKHKEAIKMFDNKNVSYEQALDVLTVSQKLNGNLQKIDFQTVHTKVMENKNKEEILYEYSVIAQYDSNICAEEIVITNETGLLKIAGYKWVINK